MEPLPIRFRNHEIYVIEKNEVLDEGDFSSQDDLRTLSPPNGQPYFMTMSAYNKLKDMVVPPEDEKSK